MKNKLLITIAIEHDNDGGAAFWYVISVSPCIEVVYFDLIHTKPRSWKTIYSLTLSRGDARQLATYIKPMPYKQLHPPTPNEVSKYRAQVP